LAHAVVGMANVNSIRQAEDLGRIFKIPS
jgi:hypothetical protein